MDNKSDKINNNESIKIDDIDSVNIKSNESMKLIPKSYYDSLLNHYYFNKKMMHEMKNTFSTKYNDIREECNKLKNELNIYNKSSVMEEKEDNSISSIFKRKDKSELSDKKVILNENDNKQKQEIKNVSSQQGGNKTVSHKSEEKKKHAKIKSESEKSDSSSDEEETETTERESESNSSSYDDTSDIYNATATEDGINKAYSKLSREMEQISKMQKGGKMKGKEVVKRINFLLSGLQILDNVKKSNKKKK